MSRIIRHQRLFVIFPLLILFSGCKFIQTQSPAPTPTGISTAKTLQTVPALPTVGPTRTHQPTPIQTQISGTRVPQLTQDLSNLDPSSVIQAEATEVPVLPADGSQENETSEDSSNSTAAELANSGTHFYRVECISATGNIHDCTCGPTEVEEIQMEFSDGRIELGNQIESYYSFIKVAENTYQFDWVQNEIDLVDTLVFMQHGFERELMTHSQSENCTFEISYLLSGEPFLTPTPTPEPITLTKYGFGQKGRILGFAFIVENPNTDLAFESSHYHLIVYDENNVEVGSEAGLIELLFPQQILGIASDLLLEEGVAASKIDVQLYQGIHTPAEPRAYFQVESTAFYTGETYFSIATGIVHNLSSEDFTDLHVSAIVYDEEGNIVGGGDKTVNFLLGKDSRGIEVEVISADQAAYVELYPYKPNLYYFASEEPPGVASEIQVIDYGFGQDDDTASYGFLIENPNSDYAIFASQYHLTAYSVDGLVVVIDEGDINLLLPGQELGVGGYLIPLFETMKIDHIGVQVREGHYVESEPYPFFAYENVAYQTDKVTGVIINPYSPDDVDDLRVSAIAFNEDGEIIGGGYGYTLIEPTPEFKKFALEVWVPVASVPSRVELFASIVIKSIFE